MIFVNNATPYLRILVADGSYVQFLGGKLELDEGDHGYAEALAEAQRNPAIAIVVNETTCDLCGEVFEGRKASDELDEHRKDIHFDVWQAEQHLAHQRAMAREVKSRAGFACSDCAPVQTFGSEDDLADHVRVVHTAPPELDGDGNDVGGERRPGEAEPPKARSSRKG